MQSVFASGRESREDCGLHAAMKFSLGPQRDHLVAFCRETLSATFLVGRWGAGERDACSDQGQVVSAPRPFGFGALRRRRSRQRGRRPAARRVWLQD